jgi:hypothetical protein
MSRADWVMVHSGPSWEIDLLRGVLEDAGIPTRVPDPMTRIVDPFILGPNGLQTPLLVPPGDAERAQEVLVGLREEGRFALPDEDELDEEEPERGPEEVGILASRARWLASLVITFPLAVITLVSYRRACRRWGLRDDKDRHTVGVVVVSGIVFVALVVGVAWGLAHLPPKPFHARSAWPTPVEDHEPPPVHPGLR